jgi:hypothetical protein
VFILTTRGCFGLVVAVAGVIGDIFFVGSTLLGMGIVSSDDMHASKGYLDILMSLYWHEYITGATEGSIL